MGAVDTVADFAARYLTWTRALVVLGGAAVAFLFLPDPLASALQIDGLRPTYGKWAGVVAVFCGVGLLVEVAASAARRAGASGKGRLRLALLVSGLSRREWRILEAPLEAENLGFVSARGDAVAWGLARKGLLRHEGAPETPGLPTMDRWSITPEAWPALESAWRRRKWRARASARRRRERQGR